MNEHNRSAWSGRAVVIALILCLVFAGGLAYTALKRPVEPETTPAQDTAVVQTRPQPAAPVVKPEKVEEVTPTEAPTEPEEELTETVQPIALETPEPEELVPQVVSPLDGTTVTVFSMTELMYDETMADWRTHSGVDIQAGEGDAVKTAAGGVVLSVTDNELMGTTVVIEHGGGYTTQYSSLQAEPPVAAGEQVAAGDIIGYVGNTAAAESTMGPHLHFSVSQNGELVDPTEYVK